jgi:hypothetical protein
MPILCRTQVINSAIYQFLQDGFVLISHSLEQFHRNGCFIYQDACLSADNLEKLKASLVELDRSHTYQFHLSDVRLDPYTTQPTVAPVRRRQSTRTSRSNSSSSSEDASGSSNEVSRYSGASGFDDPNFSENLNFFRMTDAKQARTELALLRVQFAKELRSVFQSGLAWNSIKIERVYFQQGSEGKYYLNDSFHGPLLSHLSGHNSLASLSLNPFFLGEGIKPLGKFLTKNTHLQNLSLGLTAGGPADWEELGSELAKHPRLIQANFENTVLNNANCSGLLILAENYYKEGITFPKLQVQNGRTLTREMNKEYQALTERLRGTPQQRFIDERLSEASILDLVTSTLIKIKSAQKATYYKSSLHDSAGPKEKIAEGALRVVGRLIDATVNEAQAADGRLERSRNKDAKQNQIERALTLFAYLIGVQDPETIRHSDEAYQVLPKVYQDNREHLDDHLSLLKLNLNDPHPDPDKNQSIAYFLLDKVYKIKNAQALQLLMKAEVNIYRSTSGVQEAFLVKVSRSNDQDMLPLQQALLKQITKDKKAMEKIEKDLVKQYPELILLYLELDQHLDRYAEILRARGDDTKTINRLIAKLKSALILVWKEDTAANRAVEFSEIKCHFQESVLSIMPRKDIRSGNNEFESARKCFKDIIEISNKAKKGRFMSSNLHGDVVRISEDIINQISVIQNQFTNQYKGEAEALAADKTELQEKLSQTKVRCAEEVSKITKEMQAERARVQEERARVQAEQDRLQAERAEIEARVEARMQELERLFKARMGLPQNQAAASDSETAEGMGFPLFTARR